MIKFLAIVLILIVAEYSYGDVDIQCRGQLIDSSSNKYDYVDFHFMTIDGHPESYVDMHTHGPYSTSYAAFGDPFVMNPDGSYSAEEHNRGDILNFHIYRVDQMLRADGSLFLSSEFYSTIFPEPVNGVFNGITCQ